MCSSDLLSITKCLRKCFNFWRLQNDTSRHIAAQQAHMHEDAIADEPSFTDITLDVHNSAFRTTGFGSSGFDRTTGFGSSHLGPLDDPKLGKQS